MKIQFLNHRSHVSGVFTNYMWLVVTLLDSVAIQDFYYCRKFQWRVLAYSIKT